MDYTNAINMALEAAKIRTDYFQHEPNLRYLEEACEWIQVANIYLEQMLIKEAA